jgi:hypothetical protein
MIYVEVDCCERPDCILARFEHPHTLGIDAEHFAAGNFKSYG